MLKWLLLSEALDFRPFCVSFRGYWCYFMSRCDMTFIQKKIEYKIQTNYLFYKVKLKPLWGLMWSETVSCGFHWKGEKFFLPRVTSTLQDSVDGYYSNTVLDLKQMWRYVSECSLFQNPWVVLSDCDDVVFDRLFDVFFFQLLSFFCTNPVLFCAFWMMCGRVWSTCPLCLSMTVGNRFLFLFCYINVLKI